MVLKKRLRPLAREGNMSVKSLGKIYVAGHKGLVGSHLVKVLKKKKYTDLVLPSRQELNLLDAEAVKSFLKQILV